MITTERLTIRSLEREDFRKLHKIKNDPDVISGEGHFFPISYERLEKIYSSYLLEDKRKALVIEDKKTRQLIGEISLDIDWPNRCAEVGITIEKSHWGRGIAIEALKAVANHAFRKMALNRLQAWIASSNAASLKAFEKAGFVREGVFRKAKIRDGQFSDIVWVSILATDKGTKRK